MVKALSHAAESPPGHPAAGPNLAAETRVMTPVDTLAAKGSSGVATASAGSRRLAMIAAVASVVLLLAGAAGYLVTRPKPGQRTSQSTAANTLAAGTPWTMGAPFDQSAAVPRGLPLFHGTVGPAGVMFGSPELFGTNPANVKVTRTDAYTDVTLLCGDSRVRLLSLMTRSGDYLGETTIAIRPGSRMTVRWVSHTAPDGDHAMVLRGDAQTLAYGFCPSGGKPPEEANSGPHPDLFTGRPLTLTSDGQHDGSFNVFLNQEQQGNFSAGHPWTGGVMGFEAFGVGEFRILSLSAYQRS